MQPVDFRRIDSALVFLKAGWPDLANIRLLCDRLLWVVFFENFRSSQNFRASFSKMKQCIKFNLKRVGLHIWAFFFTNASGHPVWKTSLGPITDYQARQNPPDKKFICHVQLVPLTKDQFYKYEVIGKYSVHVGV
jgi:hypothetical protein